MGGSFPPLFAAAQSGRLDVVRYLSQHGADVRVVDDFGWTAAHVTATYGHVAPQDQARLFRYMFWRALLSAYLRLDRFCQLVYAYTVMGYAILSHFVLRPVANAFRPVA